MRQFLSSIEIEHPNTIAGSEFYHHLTTACYTGCPIDKKTGHVQIDQEYKYLLKYDISYGSKNLIIQHNSDIAYKSLEIKINYKLLNKDTDQILTHGTFSKFASHETLFSSYNQFVDETAFTIDLAIFAAEEVKTRLIIYFLNKKTN